VITRRLLGCARLELDTVAQRGRWISTFRASRWACVVLVAWWVLFLLTLPIPSGEEAASSGDSGGGGGGGGGSVLGLVQVALTRCLLLVRTQKYAVGWPWAVVTCTVIH
jgi:hypothetical protein